MPVAETRQYSQTHTDLAATLSCLVMHSCLHHKSVCVSVDGFLTAQMRHVFWIRRKTFQCVETCWASNQRLLPGWGTEEREAPQCVSKLIKASTCTKVHRHTRPHSFTVFAKACTSTGYQTLMSTENPLTTQQQWTHRSPDDVTGPSQPIRNNYLPPFS